MATAAEAQQGFELDEKLKSHIQLNLNKILGDLSGTKQLKVVADETIGHVWLETVGSQNNINIKGNYGYTGSDSELVSLSAIGKAVRESLGILNTAVIHLGENGKISNITQENSRDIVR